MVEKDQSPLVLLALEFVYPLRVSPRPQCYFHLPCLSKALKLQLDLGLRVGVGKGR